MSLLEGKKGLILGVANNRSIAWSIAEQCNKHGAQLAFTYQGEALEKRVVPLAKSLGSELVIPCDVCADEDIQKVVEGIKSAWGGIDFIVHSVAWGDLKTTVSESNREGFLKSMEVSVYSLLSLTGAFRQIMNPGASVLTMSYLGAVSVVPNYRVMGIAKAALEAAVRELAAELGPDGIRINAISAGPIKTLAASGISDFKKLLSHFEGRAPLRRLTEQDDVGKSSVYMLSDLACGVTGEVHYVDCGFNVTAV